MNHFFPGIFLSIVLLLISPLALCAGLLDAGMQAYERQDYKLAYEQLLPLAEEGDAQAQYFIGSMLVDGMGVPGDPVKGVYWLEQAISKKYYKAAMTLGKMYLSGYGVAMDTDKGAKYILLSESLATEDDAEPDCD
jgi:TPR repeat protein